MIFILVVNIISWLSSSVYGLEPEPICSFIAATNIGSFEITSMWSCNATGVPTSSPCSPTWSGIVCNGDTPSSGIISINVSGLSGTICSDIGSFPQLQSLVVTSGHINGSIPTTIGSLTSLKLLDFSSNLLSGSIPSELMGATALSRLLLVENSLTGNILSDITALTSLVELDLGVNLFRGSIPDSISSLHALTALQLTDNMLTGSIPSSLISLSSLVILGVGDNHLIGELPRNVSNLVQLESFVATGNNFTGTLSSSYCSLTRLVLFSISDNILTGSLPSCMLQSSTSFINDGISVGLQSAWSYLVLFGVDTNFFTGPLPLPLPTYGTTNSNNNNSSGLPAVRQLLFDHNFFTGTIINSLNAMPTLLNLNLGYNSLSGSLPSSLGSANTGLSSLFLGYNSFTGSIPSEWSGCTSLAYIYINHNHLSGSLPMNMGALQPQMVGFMAGFNPELGGVIPSSMASPPGVQVLGLQSTSVTGLIPPQFCSSSGMLINVENTNIHCISGCLKISQVFIAGINPNCHDGSIMRQFVILVVCILSVLFGASLCTWVIHMSASNSSSRNTLAKAVERFDAAFASAFSSAQVVVKTARETVTRMTLHFRAPDAPTPSKPTPFAWMGESVGFVVIMSLLKLFLVVGFTFSISNWWSYGPTSSAERNAGSVDSCTNSKSTGCRSFCPGNIEVITVSIQDDFIEYTGSPSVEQYSYCVALFPGSCAYEYWLKFKLVPLCGHLLQFVLQCVALWLHRDFVPQQLQYDVVIAYMFPNSFSGSNSNSNSNSNRRMNVLSKSRNSKSSNNSRGSNNSSNGSNNNISRTDTSEAAGVIVITATDMIRELNQYPAYSIFALLEVATAVYVWGELLYPPVYCGSVRPLSMYYYPILMTIFDVGKLNVYTASRHIQASQMCEGMFALLNVYVLATNLWTSVVLAVLFVYHYVYCVGKSILSFCVFTSMCLSAMCGKVKREGGGGGGVLVGIKRGGWIWHADQKAKGSDASVDVSNPLHTNSSGARTTRNSGNSFYVNHDSINEAGVYSQSDSSSSGLSDLNSTGIRLTDVHNTGTNMV